MAIKFDAVIATCTRVLLSRMARDIITRDHAVEVSARLRRSLTTRAPQLTAPQLADLGLIARITFDRELQVAVDLTPWSHAAMATCVDRQAEMERSVAVGRLLQIEERSEYQPWSAIVVLEVVS